jgi:hypothetical protein
VCPCDPAGHHVPICLGSASRRSRLWLVFCGVQFRSWKTLPGSSGSCVIGFAVGLFLLGPDWSELGRQAIQRMSTSTEKAST